MSGTLWGMMSRDWANLARQVKDRREELGLTQEGVAALGGPSTATVRLIENEGAKSYRQKTFSQLETALSWRSGTIARQVLAGQDAIVEDEPLGDHLRRRRIMLGDELGCNYRDLAEFSADRDIDTALILRAETGQAAALTGDERAEIEEAYWLTPGSLTRSAVTGSLEPRQSLPEARPADPDRTYLLERIPALEPGQRAILAGIVRSWENPPAATDQRQHA